MTEQNNDESLNKCEGAEKNQHIRSTSAPRIIHVTENMEMFFD